MGDTSEADRDRRDRHGKKDRETKRQTDKGRGTVSQTETDGTDKGRWTVRQRDRQTKEEGP